MPRGRPRKLTIHSDEPTEQKPEEVKEKKEKAYKYQPFTNADDLPAARYINGQLDVTTVRFYCARHSGGSYKLIGVYKKPLQKESSQWKICRFLAKHIKPQKENRPQDRAMLKQWQKAGIPGAY